MGVHAPNEQMGSDGLGESHAAFKEAHESNSKQLLNLAEGHKKSDPRPPYDPSHPDNHWPLMVHHPAKGELTIGRSLKGIAGPSERASIAKANEAEKASALKLGYRLEPYVKPQIAVLDPAAEKAAMLQENQNLKGQMASMADLLAKMNDRIEAQEKK